MDFYFRMAINSAYEAEPENNNERSTEKADGKNAVNVPLDTYFSDEKIPIPDRVSEIELYTVSDQSTLFFIKNSLASAFVHYGPLRGLVF